MSFIFFGNNAHHSEEAEPHLSGPHLGAGGAEPVDDHLKWGGGGHVTLVYKPRAGNHMVMIGRLQNWLFRGNFGSCHKL
jgi:hypothetical protein